MCTRPIKIRNRKIDLNILNDKEFLFVPCGHCSECLRNYQKSYEIRAFYEWKQTLAENGSCFFYTLTYNDKCLPHVTILEKTALTETFPVYRKGVYRTIPCFDKEQVQLFLRRLDARIWRSFGCRLRYFLTSEYGGKTHRPHYHVLFFTSASIPPRRFRELVSACWKFGFNAAGKNYGIVQNINAIRYTAKYTAKDIDAISELSSLADEELFNKVKPFHLQSQGFGLYALACMSVSQRKYGECLVPSSSNSTVKHTVLPTYLLRKYYYSVCKNSHGTNSYVLNEQGKIRKLLLYDRLRSTSLATIEGFLKCPPVDKEFTTELRSVLKEKFSLDGDFKSNLNLLFDSILNGNPVSHLIDYSLVYRGRNAILPVGSARDDLSYFMRESDPLPFESKNTQKKYDDLPCFQNYDKLLEIVALLNSWHSYKSYLDGVRKYNAIQVQRVARGIYKEKKLLDEVSFLSYLNL